MIKNFVLFTLKFSIVLGFGYFGITLINSMLAYVG
jgi:hypothetical protein